MENICVTLWCDDWLCVCVFSDRWQQLLARSLHGANIPPDHGVLQPVHLHERSESGGRRAGPRHQAAGGRAAGGKREKKTTTAATSCRWRWLVLRQANESLFMLAAACFSATVVIQHSHSWLSPRSSLPSSPSGCCHGNPGLQLSVAMEITSRRKEGENEEDTVETKRVGDGQTDVIICICPLDLKAFGFAA